MTKLKKPLFSIDAWGPLGPSLIYRKYKALTVATKRPHPRQPNTPHQLTWRTMYQAAIALWHDLSPAEKSDWNRVARPHHMNGFPFFMSSCLKPNPGIYLPLAGGTMTGPIAMGANKITGLGAPVDPNDAARLADAGGGSATTIGNYTGDNTVNRAIPHGLAAAPNLVIINQIVSPYQHHIYNNYAYIFYIHPANGGKLAITATDNTNFYVGNATDYNYSGNMNGRGYRWIAIP